MPKTINIKTILLDFMRANKCDIITGGPCRCSVEKIEECGLCEGAGLDCEPAKIIDGGVFTLTDIERCKNNDSDVS